MLQEVISEAVSRAWPSLRPVSPSSHYSGISPYARTRTSATSRYWISLERGISSSFPKNCSIKNLCILPQLAWRGRRTRGPKSNTFGVSERSICFIDIFALTASDSECSYDFKVHSSLAFLHGGRPRDAWFSFPAHV